MRKQNRGFFSLLGVSFALIALGLGATASAYQLKMLHSCVGPGQWFTLERVITEIPAEPVRVNEFIVLDIQGMFWFWPSWTSDFDYLAGVLDSETEEWKLIMEFIWPEGFGAMDGLKFYGALMNEDMTALIGELAFIEWSFTEDQAGFELGTTRFAEGGTIPERFSCNGDNISPPLWWSNPPVGTQSFAMIMDDPDAPGGTWTHWVIYNIPADVLNFSENIPADPEWSDGTRQGLNSWGAYGYGGPCPPSGTHRYYFKLYALDAILDLEPGASVSELEQAMTGHILEEIQLMGRYSSD